MTQATAATPTSPASGPRGARLLLVGGVPELLVRRDGWEVVEADDARDALAAMRVQAPDVVLVDLSHHDHGLEAIRALKAEPTLRWIPLLAIVGPSDGEARGRALEAGADDYLLRPVAEAELDHRVRTQVELAALRGEAARRQAEERERGEAERERTRLLEEARQASRMKDEFLALLSHELRTPLSAIVGWAHMLRTGTLDPETSTRAIETIERNAKLQNQLIEDILDVSRIVAGKFHVDMRTVDLVRVVEAARDTVAPLATSRGVELEMTVSAASAVTTGDPDRLQQVVWNLLTNAIKFTPRGGRVRVELAREPSEFRVTVTDTGAGIEPEFLPHIFERFRQEGTAGARRQGGLGLGLSLVRHIVELHGGTVSGHSPGAGRGATFTVLLPIVDAAAEAARVPPFRARPAEDLEHAPRLDGVRVLVVDDQPDARNLIAAVLQERGARVFMAGSAAEALDLLRSERPDVLLSDISLPNEDGYSLMRKVRQLPEEPVARTPAAALTAFSRVEDRIRALSAGYQLHVGKPVDPAELIAVVARLIGRG